MDMAACVEGDYRWWLSREWDSSKPSVCWIMLNPSTADASKNDPTLTRIIDFSQRFGFGSLTVVNLYPFRSSSPKECKAWAKDWDKRQAWEVRDALMFNLNYVNHYANLASKVVLAWGAGANFDMEWPDLVIDEIESDQLYCLGETMHGHPKHPLYLNGETELMQWKSTQ